MIRSPCEVTFCRTRFFTHDSIPSATARFSRDEQPRPKPCNAKAPMSTEKRKQKQGQLRLSDCYTLLLRRKAMPIKNPKQKDLQLRLGARTRACGRRSQERQRKISSKCTRRTTASWNFHTSKSAIKNEGTRKAFSDKQNLTEFFPN